MIDLLLRPLYKGNAMLRVIAPDINKHLTV